MTTETPEPNGTQMPEATTPTTTATPPKRGSKTTMTKAKEVVAISVKDANTEQSGGLKLMTPHEGIPGNRPVEASHLKIISTYTSVGGQRPVVASGMDIKSTLTISGSRPIVASHLHISETYAVMGNRPVASNEIDDPATLMGFLD